MSIVHQYCMGTRMITIDIKAVTLSFGQDSPEMRRSILDLHLTKVVCARNTSADYEHILKVLGQQEAVMLSSTSDRTEDRP